MRPSLLQIAASVLLLGIGTVVAQDVPPAATDTPAPTRPIVGGHRVQPTRGDIQDRTRDLPARSRADQGFAATLPRSSANPRPVDPNETDDIYQEVLRQSRAPSGIR